MLNPFFIFFIDRGGPLSLPKYQSDVADSLVAFPGRSITIIFFWALWIFF